jgi:hypothetical protein
MNLDFKTKSFLVGFTGDVLLQTTVYYNGDFAGLKSYFDTHNPFESVFIAGGMMFGFAFAYELTGLPLEVIPLAIYGATLDIAFRNCRLFPSLENYYQTLNPILSIFWGIVPMVLPLFIPL